MAGPNRNLEFQQVVQKFDPQSKLLRVWALTGGISAQVTALEICRPDGRIEKMIVRQHGIADLRQRPRVAAEEFRLLELTRSAGLNTPKPYFLDESCEILPTPYVVVEYMEGKPEFAPPDRSDFLLQCATHLSRIHGLDDVNTDLSFLPLQELIFANKLAERPPAPDQSVGEGRIREVLASVWPLPRANSPVLLHGDYWPGNILWKDGQLVAVIDWEDAAVGDPLADVANGRLEILWALGIDGMNRFTHQYQSLAAADFTHLPYWDLCAALRLRGFAQWAGDKTEMMRERHRWFVVQALSKILGEAGGV